MGAGLLIWLTQDRPVVVDRQPKAGPERDPLEPREILTTPFEMEFKGMKKTEGPDPYLPPSFYTAEQRRKIIGDVKALTTPQKNCFNEFIKDYQDTTFKHCQEHDLGRDADGGCEQIAYKYSIHLRVIDEALKNCGS